MIPDTLSELDAAIAYAHAWNTLDCTEFVRLLASDARYASQYNFGELAGRDAIAEYLCGKFEVVKSTGPKVKAVLSTATTTSPGKYCVRLIQGSENAVVVFDTRGNEIHRFTLCVTVIYSPQSLGIGLGIDGKRAPIQDLSAHEIKANVGTLDERLDALLRMHAESIARTGESASAYSWTSDWVATGVLRMKLETGCARAMLAKSENAASQKRTEALDRYIRACKLASAALEDVSSALDGIEDSV